MIALESDPFKRIPQQAPANSERRAKPLRPPPMAGRGSKPRVESLLFSMAGGEGGIRTLGRALRPYDGLANRCFRPLSHLSGLDWSCIEHRTTRAVGRTIGDSGIRGALRSPPALAILNT